MPLFRRDTIFHTEEALPDPEDLKLRFRRRTLLCALLGFLLVLGVPVARELRASLKARSSIRHFVEQMLEWRTQAALARSPLLLELSADRQTWTVTPHLPGNECKAEAPGPAFPYSIQGAFWKIQARLENGEAIAGKKLCWSPRDGLFLDSTPLAGGNLLITLSAPREEGTAEQDLASALITQSGAEFQILTY